MSGNPATSGTQRAAAFLLSLDKDARARVMRHLDPKVVSDVARAMTELEPTLCTAEAIDDLFADLARTVYLRAGVRPQDDFELREILQSTFGGEDAERVLNEIHERRRREQPFAFLEDRAVDAVGRVLSEESAAVVALIMAHVSPLLSAEVLAGFEPERALDVVKRMTTIIPPGIETLLNIADDLQRRLVAIGAAPTPRDRSDSLRTVADLLNFSQSETEKAVLEGLEDESEDIAAQIREYMFTWDDLGTVDKRAMQMILASVDTRTLSVALKASPSEVEENVLANLSSRVRVMVADERELAGAVPLTDVVQARNEILKTVRTMMESGEFTPTRSGEELVS